MAEIAVNIAAKELSDVKNLKENMKVLIQKIELLNSREADVLTALQGAETISGKKRKREVENWLKSVDEKRREFKRLGLEIEQTKTSNIVARRRLAKQVVQVIDEVAELVEQGRFPEGIVVDAIVKESVPLVTFRAKGLAFERNLENIWSWLMDDEVLSIGIYGMGGVGKTMLAMHLHNKLIHEPKFSSGVYWVTVSQESNNFKLQDDVAKSIKLDISDEDDEKKRAALLFQALSKRKKFVLILDDVWKQFDVWKIGLPLGKDVCKLLITSRYADVCQRIGCQKLRKVEVLSESEAWELFREELGLIMLAPEIEETATKVAEKCDQLPLGIITMARSMRGVTDIHGWEDALEELNESCMAQHDMNSEVLPVLLYSFNRLRNQKLQFCFLFCSLYPEDYEILRDELIHMFIIEELMDRRSSRHAEFNQGHAILTELENSCLLISSEDHNGNKYVKMHDLIREMALWITRDNPRFMVKAGLQLWEIPPVSDWNEDLNKVSLMRNQIMDIPAGTFPECPSLSTLRLSYNPLRVVPESFFLHMSRLKILDLRETTIVQLPNSISDLGDLKALLLSHCWRLTSLPSLKKLKELRELDLSCTNIQEVIHGTESLANLKCLNLYRVSLKMIPSGTLRKLSRLHRLILPIGKAVAVDEVEGLRYLEEFQGTFYGMSDFNRFIKSRYCYRQLCFYDIGVGKIYPSQTSFEDSISRLTCKKVIMRRHGHKEIRREDEIVLPRDIEVLHIMCCEDCEDIECLMRLTEQQGHRLLLENLECLRLNELPNFRGIIKCEPQAVKLFPPSTLSRLRVLEILNCKRIKNLLPRGLVENLQNLEDLTVVTCEQMEVIIGEDECKYRSVDVVLPRLRRLILWDLPKLTSMGITVKSVPGDVSVSPPSSLPCLRELEISGCQRIKKLLPGGLVDSLQNLEGLRVYSCEQMEEIISARDEGVFGFSLPRLRDLILEDLPELRSTSVSTTICDSIETIRIQKCSKLKKIPLFRGRQSAPPSLHEIVILEKEREWWDSLEWDHFDINHALQPLVKFECDK